jgi:geranylgeranyl pyrophosphate synthase
MKDLFHSFYTQYQSEIIDQLGSFFHITLEPFSLLSGGKYLRSLLFFSANPQNETTIRTAFLIELIHATSLVHDDIVDESSLRRGKPTLFRELGVPKATAIGYYLLSYLQQQLLLQSPLFYQACFHTLESMCKGQLQEIHRSGSKQYTIDEYIDTITWKTASLFELSTGWIDSHFNESEAYFGTLFGQTFQIMDDIQDFILSEEKTGKPFQQDTAQKVLTLPVLLAKQHGKSQVDEASIREACLFGIQNLDSAISQFPERNRLKNQLTSTLQNFLLWGQSPK